MRQPPSIPEVDLCACLRDHYDLAATTLEFLSVGLDTRAGVYRVMSAQGTPYLLKVKSGSLYEPGYLASRYLADLGIASVVAPLPTTQGALWTQVGPARDWTALLFPFIEGDVGWKPAMTAAQWQAVGAALKQIHQAPPPRKAMLQRLRVETFDPDEYGRWVRRYDAELAHADGGTPIEQALRAQWMEHRATIHGLLTTMESLARQLRTRSGPRVICHADLHPSNIIRAPNGEVFIIDWDDVMLAPKERDFLFVGDPPADGVVRDTASPFFHGYGPVENDWVALTYYRCERVMQDAISFAQEACFRDDLGPEAQADAVRFFAANLAPGGMMGAARAAAAHLPTGLGLRNDL